MLIRAFGTWCIKEFEVIVPVIPGWSGIVCKNISSFDLKEVMEIWDGMPASSCLKYLGNML